MTIGEVCIALDLDPWDVLRLLRQKRLLISEESVEEYIAQRLPAVTP